MFSNRISRFSASNFVGAAAFVPLPTVVANSGVSQAAPSFGASNAQTMVLIPTVTLATWQQQVYRLAYQKALADTAPPRHFARFFSVWN
jgi:hypothetical protein